VSPRPDVSEDRKEQILGAAAKVFARLGFQKARMDDIVRASGLSKGALYWYFASKDELIIALLDQLFGASISQLEAALKDDGSVPEQLRRLTQRIIDDVDRGQSLIPITYEFYAWAMRSKTVRKYVSAYYARYREGLIRLIRQGQKRGELRADLDPSVSALAYVALFEGMILIWVIDPKAVRFPRDLSLAAEQAVRGLEAPPVVRRNTRKEKT
jgi:AcrR family transcriptional regulator